MRALLGGIGWALRQLLFLASLVTAAVALLLLPMLVVPRGRVNGFGYVIDGFRIAVEPYWGALSAHLKHLVRGQLVPPAAQLRPGDPLTVLPEQLMGALPVTLQLVGAALLASLLLGLLLGLLLSRIAPAWLRTPLWGASTLLSAVPDLLVASSLSMAIFLLSRQRGESPSWGSDAWHRFWAPTLSLTLIALPYVARVTATALDELIQQVYIRAAVARGLHPIRILFKHLGKGVLIRLVTHLPALVGLLCSAAAVVEYVTEVGGVGRLLIRSASNQLGSRYAGVALLIPLLLLFMAALAAADLLQRWLDPRLGSLEAPTVKAAQWGWGLPSWRAIRRGIWALFLLPVSLVRSLLGLLRWLWRGLRDPILLLGLLLVLVLVGVAVVAPQLAPLDPALQKLIKVGADGSVEAPPFPPGAEHLLGTDGWGRDVYSRLLLGTRYALLFALLAVPTRFLLAVPVGLAAAFRGGLWARWVNWSGTFFMAVPQFLLPLALLPAVNQLFRHQPDLALGWAVLLIALPGAPRLATVVRQQAVEVLNEPFMEGATAVGAGTTRRLFRYLLPQLVPQLATLLALEIPAVLTMTTLLGYFKANPGGVLYDTQTFRVVGPLLPEWGSLMERPVVLLLSGRWWLWAPFGALCLAVLAFTLLGEGIRRASEGRTHWRWR